MSKTRLFKHNGDSYRFEINAPELHEWPEMQLLTAERQLLLTTAPTLAILITHHNDYFTIGHFENRQGIWRFIQDLRANCPELPCIRDEDIYTAVYALAKAYLDLQFHNNLPTKETACN